MAPHMLVALCGGAPADARAAKAAASRPAATAWLRRRQAPALWHKARRGRAVGALPSVFAAQGHVAGEGQTGMLGSVFAWPRRSCPSSPKPDGCAVRPPEQMSGGLRAWLSDLPHCLLPACATPAASALATRPLTAGANAAITAGAARHGAALSGLHCRAGARTARQPIAGAAAGDAVLHV